MKVTTKKDDIVREVQSVMFEINAIMMMRSTTTSRSIAWLDNAAMFGSAMLAAIEAAAELLSKRTRAGTTGARYALGDLFKARDRVRDLAAHCGFGCAPSKATEDKMRADLERVIAKSEDDPMDDATGFVAPKMSDNEGSAS